MSDSIIVIIIINLILWCLIIVGWIYSARKDRELAIKRWKYNMKAQKYSELYEALDKTLTYLSVIKKINMFDLENEENLKANFIELSGLAGVTLSDLIFEDYMDIVGDIDDREDITVEKLQEIRDVVISDCWLEYYSSIKDYRIQRDAIDLSEPDNIVIKKLEESIDKLMGEEAIRLTTTSIFLLGDLEGLIPPENPDIWIGKVVRSMDELKKIMKKDLKQTL